MGKIRLFAQVAMNKKAAAFVMKADASFLLCIFCSPQTGGKDKDMYFNQVEFGLSIPMFGSHLVQ